MTPIESSYVSIIQDLLGQAHLRPESRIHLSEKLALVQTKNDFRGRVYVELKSREVESFATKLSDIIGGYFSNNEYAPVEIMRYTHLPENLNLHVKDHPINVEIEFRGYAHAPDNIGIQSTLRQHILDQHCAETFWFLVVVT